MRQQFFITGTDTNVGKTEIATAILCLARQKGLSTAAFKPIAAGCELIDGEWKNLDAIRLQQQCSLALTYSEINPVALKRAIAPHLAAYEEKKTITIERLAGFTHNVFNKKADLTVIEGVGGWRVPISHRELMSQYVQEIKVPVVLVVGMRLGCINHALLTMEAIARDKVPFAGWVANCLVKDMPALQENIQTLERFLPAPCLGVVPFLEDPSPEKIAGNLSMGSLLN